MGIAYQILGQVYPAAATPTTLYTVPAATSAVISTLSIANLGVSTTYRVAARKAGAALASQHYQAYDVPLAANNSVMLTVGYTLAATDVVTVQSASGAVAFSLFGAENT